MEEECWTGEHWKYAMAVGIPSFVIWGIGLPFLAFLRLFKLNALDKLYFTKNKQVYGFLFLGYLHKKYWWELVILARKTFILANLVWLSRISTMVQAITALAFLWCAIYL